MKSLDPGNTFTDTLFNQRKVVFTATIIAPNDIESRTRVWEDNIRDQERQKSFGETFIRLARSVYQQNDRRSIIKKEINTTYGSALVEEKSYEHY